MNRLTLTVFLLALAPRIATAQIAEASLLKLGFGVSAPAGFCDERPLGPACPVPPRLPPPAAIGIAELAKNVQVKSARELVFSWMRPMASSQTPTGVAVAIYSRGGLVFQKTCSCKEQLARLKPGGTVMFTLENVSEEELRRHFVGENSLVVYIGFGQPGPAPKSTLTIFNKEILALK